ncbi:MAG: hypothetical protein ABJN95_02590 [Maribacter sp.]|uniref:hypothetical protein n=1 Tax=Maribacter sp. TaxID=1897614 RepID=UPI003298AA5F
MRLLCVLFLFISPFCLSQELEELRMEYPKANSDAVVANTLFQGLSSISKTDNKVLVAYKGAVTTLKAKFAKRIKDKKTFFKEGAQLLEHAIASEPQNLEIRCLRLGVQENSPKIVGYKDSIQEDKQFLLKHYKTTTNKSVRKFVKGYVLLSKVFSEAEKQLF